ncbi:MAG: hypothetical protein KGO94_02370 [Alphaproteobacteria bacterium]|nr:hypothetical protein [Alphaproteobacteria bacterium]
MKITPDGERARVAVPVLYPSGSSAAVEVVFNAGKCFVTDLALGQMEAEMQGASNFYGDAAKKSVQRFGVGYDGLSIFAIWASLDKIESAIVSVANASVFAASNAIYKAVTEKEKRKNEELFEKIVRVFGKNDVVKDDEVIGRDAVWPAHNIVSLRNNRKAIFEYITPHQNSISGKYMMFSDLAKLEDKYSLTSVVNSIDSLGPKGAMLAEVSEVIQLAASDTEYLKRAA